jgi:hypothetical protein
MTFDPAAYRHLDGLAKKYRDWLTQFTSDGESGPRVLDADGIGSSLAECYADALVTAQAVYVYLLENGAHEQTSTEREPVPPPPALPVDVSAS